MKIIKDYSLLEKINIIYDYVISRGYKTNDKHYSSETEPSVSIKPEHLKRKEAYDKFKESLKPFVTTFIDNVSNPKKKKSANDLINEVLQEFNEEKKNKMIKKEVPITIKETTQTNKTPRIKKLFEKVLGVNIEKKKNTSISKTGKFTRLIGDLFKMNEEEQRQENKDISAREINFSDNTEEDKKEENKMILTPRNYLKQELEEQTKGFSFHIAEDNQKETFEFKPYYTVNKAYKNVVSKLTSINQKKVKFIKGDHKIHSMFNLNDLIQKMNQDVKEEDCLISIEPPLSNRNYEFTPFYEKNTNIQKRDTKSKEVNAKFIKGTFKAPVSEYSL